MSRKFLILVLAIAVLLVLVFVLGVGLGARKPKEPLNLEQLAAGVGKARSVELRELGVVTPASCGRPIGPTALRVPPAQTCTLSAPPTNDWPWQRRALRLSTAQPVHLVVSAKNGPVEGDPDPNETSDLPLAREGNQIQIRCGASAAVCIVSVVQ